MRRAKLQKVFGIDCHRFRFKGHAKRTKRIRCTFHPQAWINDYAVSVDPQGDTTWFADVDALPGRGTVARDNLRDHSSAPDWVREWSGPFEVTFTVVRTGSPSEADVSVTEKDDGTLVIEVERTQGQVTVLVGKIVLTLNEGDHFKVVSHGEQPAPVAPPGWPGFGKEETQSAIAYRVRWERWAAANQRLLGAEALAVGHDLSRVAYEARLCACHAGSTCDISHDPLTCPCIQCTAAEVKRSEQVLADEEKEGL